MSNKLDHNESLESLLPDGGKPSKDYQISHPSYRKTWIYLTLVINSVVLAIILVMVASSFRTLQSIVAEESIIITTPPVHQSPPASLETHSVLPLTIQQQSEPEASPKWLTCGDDRDQAIENGCIFDVMLTAWLHPECYSHEHFSDAYQKSNLTFFLDSKMTIPFPDAHTGNWPQHHIWTQATYHPLHCTYMWERQIKSWTSGSKIDSQSWNLQHSRHCMMVVLDRTDPSLGSNFILQSFTDCGRP